MKRWPGESFEDYKARRAGDRLLTESHLKGRYSSGKYFDPALHKTMQQTTDEARQKKWWKSVLFKVALIGGLIGVWYLILETGLFRLV